MPVTIVAGGQFGSEGKGKVAHYFAKTQQAEYVVRCGGPNSGHTVVDMGGVPHIFRQLPTATLLHNVKLAIAAGSYIDLNVLKGEIETYKVGPDRLSISSRAVMITPEMRQEENGLVQRIGSTGSGTGAAVVARIRRGDVIFAKDVPELREYTCDVEEKLRDSLDEGGRVLIEGTQGVGLSLYHSPYYPHVTSRDTTPAGFLSEVGLSPLDVDEVVLVLRAYPIRVAGCSGPLERETTWEKLSLEGGHREPLVEYTTVTNRIRRVSYFYPDDVIRALKVVRPSKIVLNHVDYYAADGVGRRERLKAFVEGIEASIGRAVDYVGCGRDSMLSRVEFSLRNHGGA